MRSRTGVFWYSLGLTLLLLLPVIGVTAFFLHQRQQQDEMRQAAAERGGLPIEQGAQDSWCALLVVQQEQPGFVLVRADGPAQKVTLCALPGSLQVNAPAGTTTLEACTLSAGPGRAVQLLGQTVATGETALRELYYLAATPDCWADCVGETVTARLDTAALLTPAERETIGYGEDPVAEVGAAEAETLVAQLQSCLQTPGEQADARAAVWEAFVRQNTDLLAALPEAWRSYSARTLTDFLATDLGALEQTLTYLTGQPGLTISYCTARTQAAGNGEVTLTDAGLNTLREMLQ
ncbi:hypothetical protein [uncultured Subdoligranulum sp.]|uniref:hypothetical protein n=1 Tax=uncultured Subdoligranulum sp. TaxID=512298 RepID=UPI0025CB85D4|nr:hypothetical protein [uncultured Subdoligranulum sp.]